jgi:hypothetical protein
MKGSASALFTLPAPLEQGKIQAGYRDGDRQSIMCLYLGD